MTIIGFFSVGFDVVFLTDLFTVREVLHKRIQEEDHDQSDLRVWGTAVGSPDKRFFKSAGLCILVFITNMRS